MSSTVASSPSAPPGRTGSMFNREDRIVLSLAVVAVVAAGVTRYVGGGALLAFVCSVAAVALLASLVGSSVDQIGGRLGAGATSVLQSALGNLPELFISLFALRKGLVDVVRAALIGSILANLLLVLGLCFVVGGLKHGTQQINSERARSITVLMLLSVAAMVIPSLAQFVHTPASGHEKALSNIASVVLLLVFAASLPASLKRGENEAVDPEGEAPRWPLAVAIGILTTAALLAAFVSDWFVTALQPAMDSLHINQVFAGLVIVAIAGNAIENVVGLQLAAANKADFAFAVVVNSPLQISLMLAPLLVLLSSVLGLAPLTLVFSPMLVVALVASVLIAGFITFDGESNWLEGAALIALYVIIAAAFWWG